MSKTHIAFRVNEGEERLIEGYAKRAGYDTAGSYAKALCMGGSKISPVIKKVYLTEELARKIIALSRGMNEQMDNWKKYIDVITTTQGKLIAEAKKITAEA